MDLSYITSSRGCANRCTFCYNPIVSPEIVNRPVEKVRDDVLERMTRTGRTSYYMTDQVFTLNEDRLAEMAKVFKASDVGKCCFTVEGMVGPVVKSESMVSLLGSIGVDIVKLGIENVGREFNSRTNKRQCPDDIRKALELLQGGGIKVVGYLLLDGETTAKEHKETLKFCEDASFDYYKINMLTAPKSDLGTDRYKYDAHFSTARVDEWGMPRSVVSDYLELYASRGKHPHLSHQ